MPEFYATRRFLLRTPLLALQSLSQNQLFPETGPTTTIIKSSGGAVWRVHGITLGTGRAAAGLGLGRPKKLVIWALAGGGRRFAFASFFWCCPLASCLSKFFGPPPMFLSQMLQ